jgi:hypothetical protein
VPINQEIVISAKDRTKGVFNNINKGLDGVGRRAVSLTATMGALVGVGGFGALIKSSIDLADNTGKVSEKLGVTTEALSRLQFAVGQTSEVTKDQFNVALQRMARRLEDAADKGGPVADQLEKIGLNVKDLKELSPDQAFLQIADAMQKTEDQGLKVKTAFSLFDTEGVNLVNTLQNGSEALKELGEESDRLGRTIDETTAKQAAELNDNLDALGKAAQGFGLRIATDALPQVNALTEALREAAGTGDLFGALGAQIGDALFEAFGPSQKNQLKAFKEEIASLQDELVGLQKGRDGTGFLDFFTRVDDAVLDEKVAIISNRLLELRRKVALNVASAPPPDTGRGDPSSPDLTEVAMPVSGLTIQGFNFAADQERMMLENSLSKTGALWDRAQKERTATALREQQIQQQNQANFFSLASSLMAGHSKRAFKVGKTLALANALIKGKEAVVGAYNFGAGIGGPVLGAAFATVAVAAVGAQIQAIKAQQFGAGGSVGSGGGGASVGAGSALALPDAQQSVQQTSTQVIVMGGSNLSDQDVQDLIPRINTQLENTDAQLLPENGADINNIQRL